MGRTGHGWRVRLPLSHSRVWKGGDFDEAYVGYPTVIEIGNEYRLYYHTYDRKDGMYKVGLAVAKDGLMN